jgi:MFS family permease
MRKTHQEELDEKKLNLSKFIVFLMGFSQALLVYVISSYFAESTGFQNVGIFYAVSYLIFLVVLLNMHKLVRWMGKSNIYYFSILAKIIVIAMLAYVAPSGWGAFLLIMYVVLVHIEWVAMDLIVESISTDRMSGRIRGAHLTILNAGFLFGPFVSTYLLNRMDFYGVFLAVLGISCLSLVLSLFGYRNINHRFKKKMGVIDILRKAWKNKDVMRIYYVSFVLEFFFALMVIYTPIHLRNLGYSWESIGLIFTAMLVPFLFIQYPMGVLADKRTGEKEFLVLAVIIMALATLTIYFIGTGSIALWATILFTTRIGAALIEILRDSYFFKKVDATDVDLINFFRTASSTAYISAAIISSYVLFIAPIKFIFVLTGLVVLSALYPVLRLVDNKSEKELNFSKARRKTA